MAHHAAQAQERFEEMTMRLIALMLIAALSLPGTAMAQAPGTEVWREFAGSFDIGSELNVRLTDGSRFRATLIRVDDAVLLLQPKTRVTVPVQAVPYDVIASLEKPRPGGVAVSKAIAIGAGIGAAAFWTMMAVALTLWSD
jgi:hypothetical protein